MSLYRLHQFLKENSQDVLDYWIYESRVYFARVMSCKNGNLYFIKVASQNILIPKDYEKDHLEKSNFYFMEKHHEDDLDDLIVLYDVFLCAFPEYNYKYILFQGYHIMQERDICFQIRNMSNLDNFGFYLLLDIEWFFENVYVVSHETEKIMSDVQSRVEKMYMGFLPNYQSFCSSTDSSRITHVWEYYAQMSRQNAQCRELYIKLVAEEIKTIHDINFNEKISSSDDLTFQETVRRGHQKKVLSERLEECQSLKQKTMLKSVFLHCQVWKILLKYLLLISRFTKLQSDFQNLVFDFESLVPKTRLFEA